MTAVKACMIAFSLYSRIPMPNFAWGEREKDYHLFFFPWVGALIGGLLLLWERVAAHFGVGETARVLFGTAIPLLVTGGFHVDGFMDTMDAFRSYRSREEKCRIWFCTQWPASMASALHTSSRKAGLRSTA